MTREDVVFRLVSAQLEFVLVEERQVGGVNKGGVTMGSEEHNIVDGQ